MVVSHLRKVSACCVAEAAYFYVKRRIQSVVIQQDGRETSDTPQKVAVISPSCLSQEVCRDESPVMHLSPNDLWDYLFMHVSVCFGIFEKAATDKHLSEHSDSRQLKLPEALVLRTLLLIFEKTDSLSGKDTRPTSGVTSSPAFPRPSQKWKIKLTI